MRIIKTALYKGAQQVPTQQMPAQQAQVPTQQTQAPAQQTQVPAQQTQVPAQKMQNQQAEEYQAPQVNILISELKKAVSQFGSDINQYESQEQALAYLYGIQEKLSILIRSVGEGKKQTAITDTKAIEQMKQQAKM